jgi:hypothetical protein
MLLNYLSYKSGELQRNWLYENMLSSITIKDLTFNPEDLSIVERMAKNAKDNES